ncbi:acyltransferase family protein [Paenibacillus pasadenensis]|uniref:acyltransferase family protein n=1 Tax=Paenibacillus pasadenensis TaxID=217090 RepID=UPI0020416438|nr:acyltransferase family protein [Paenibacillus pasadenensis]MCM3747643.1 acyltransferase family protein [Paenibacillus pasadenensis]
MKKNIGYIDSLKGIGAIIIALYHIIGLIGVPDSSLYFINKIFEVISVIGYIPVEMFFFFSGYLMLYNYSNKIKSIDFFDYFRKRTKLVYPYLIINITLCSLYIIIKGGYISAYQIFYNLSFLQSGFFLGTGDFRIDIAGGGTWFLAPLLLSYCIFFYICKYKDEEQAFGLYCGIVLIGIIALKNSWNYPILNGYMLRGLTGFFAGCMFSLIAQKYELKSRKLAMFGTLILLFLSIKIFYQNEYTSTLDFIIITDLVVLPLIIIFLNNFLTARKILSLFIFKRIGALSMQLFFLNLPVGYFFKFLISEKYSFNTYVQYFLYFTILFSLSLLSDYIIRKWRFSGENKPVNPPYEA